MNLCTICNKPIGYGNKTSLCIDDYKAVIKNGIKALEAYKVEQAPAKPRPSVHDVLALVSDVFCVHHTILTGRSRKQVHVRPRHAVYYLAWLYTGRSLPVIGRTIGGRDHSTIIHGIEKCKIVMERDDLYRERVEKIERKLDNYTGRIELPKVPLPKPKVIEEPEEAVAPAKVEWGDDEDEMDWISRQVAASCGVAA